MNDSEKNPTTMTAEEIKEKLRNGELKIAFAESPLVDHYSKEIHFILLAIGEYMSDDPEEWAFTAFVSDRSMMSDFDLEPDELAEISGELGVHVRKEDHLFQIAARMVGVN